MSLQGDPGPHDESEIDHHNWTKMFLQNLTPQKIFQVSI